MQQVTFDDHGLCPQCRIAAGVCNVDVANPCLTCLRQNTRTWPRLRKSLVYARVRAVQRGKQHWSSAFPHLEAWLTFRPASSAASEPGSEVSSMLESRDDGFSMTGPLVEDLVVQGNNGVSSKMADAHESLRPGAATPLLGAATQPTPSTIQPIVMQWSVQDTPSVSGPPLISIPSAAPTAGPLINMSMAATQPAATRPTATQLAAPTATPLLSTMSVRPDQMGYFTGTPNFYPQSNQFPYMANPSWEASQREQFLQNQLLQERQQFEAWKARPASASAANSARTGSSSGAFGAYCHG